MGREVVEVSTGGMPTVPTSSSGDLRADRRFLYAEASAEEGDHAAAAELLEQCLEIAPDWAAAWFALGAAQEQLGNTAASISAYSRALACNPRDVLGAYLALARLGGMPVPGSAAPAYVARLFDQYASRFESHLVQGLGYRAPALLRDAVADLCARMSRPMRFARALDLGCGTGLAGAAFRDCVDHLEGVDLSAGMIAEARAKDVYQALHLGDAVGYLKAASDREWDLVLAADVLVYVGDLAPMFGEIARVLAKGGLFAFTAESHEGEGYVLGSETRYAHAWEYIQASAKAAGLFVRDVHAASTRLNKGAEVSGLLGVISA